MATVAVLTFATAHGAADALAFVQDFQRQHGAALQDAALVSWRPEMRAPSTGPLANLETAGALGGLFWGVLLGWIFFTPLVGLAIPSPTRSAIPGGTLGSIFRDCGIDDDFLGRVRGTVTPGTSALFLVGSQAVIDLIVDAVPHAEAGLITTHHSSGDQRRERRGELAKP